MPFLKSDMALRVAADSSKAMECHGGELLLFVDSSGFPRIVVKELRNSRYDCRVIKSRKSILDNFAYACRVDPDQALEDYSESFGDYSPRSEEDVLDPDIPRIRKVLGFIIFSLVERHGFGCFEKSPQILKKRMVTDRIGLERIFETVLHVSLNRFEETFGKIDLSGSSEILEYSYGRWKVLLERGTSSVELVNRFLDDLSGRMVRFEFLCYGIIEVKRNMHSKKAFADYEYPSDRIRILGKGIGERLFMRSFIHELGHRLYYEFFSPDQIAAVRKKFREMKKLDRGHCLSPGDSVSTRMGYDYLVLDSAGVPGFWKCRIVGRNRWFVPGGKSLRKGSVRCVCFREDEVLSVNGRSASDGGFVFPSVYSKTDEDEFFAECFAEMMTGGLDSSLVEWMDEVLSIR